MSVTVTSKEPVVTCPAESSAVYVTRVVPVSKTDPLECVDVNEATEQLSVEVGSSHEMNALH